MNYERSCGECGECCFTMGIKELNKPERTPCENFCNGCEIYDSRPKSCADWNCLWIMGHLPKSQRPDRAKIVFHLPDSETSQAWGGRLVIAAESRQASSKLSSGSKSIRKLFRAGNNVMITMFDGGRNLHLHRGYLAKVLSEAKKHSIFPTINGNVVSFSKEQAEKIWQNSVGEKEIK